jgi:hypothetical protein
MSNEIRPMKTPKRGVFRPLKQPPIISLRLLKTPKGPLVISVP